MHLATAIGNGGRQCVSVISKRSCSLGLMQLPPTVNDIDRNVFDKA